MTNGETLPDVIVVGAGIIGAACAYFCTAAGMDVAVIERGAVAGGTTGSGEGNILVSDKQAGSELELGLLSRDLWLSIGAALGYDNLELTVKGSLAVMQPGDAACPPAFVAEQRRHGIDAEVVSRDRLEELEPRLAPDIVTGVFYAQDMQLQPMVATGRLLAHARAAGATLHAGTEVTGLSSSRNGRVCGIQTSSSAMPTLSSDWVVNATGVWGSAFSQFGGTRLNIEPRRGFILVTEPLPPLVKRKVYASSYRATVSSSDAGLQSSLVIESTRSGTVLIGSTRERLGFDTSPSSGALRTLAAEAIQVFPFLRDVSLMRSYQGFRPYVPDNVPYIGHDSKMPGLVHACGHEGSGIGLAPATGHLVTQLIAGGPPDMDVSPFSPHRAQADQ